LRAWKFTQQRHGAEDKQVTALEVVPPSDLPPTTKQALDDMIWAEIGEVSSLQYFIDHWKESKDTSGNATAISFHGDTVEIENIYDMWKPVKIPRDDFQDFYNQPHAFLSSQTEN
jgi:hypothetical protein